jgi:hypothetical protein
MRLPECIDVLDLVSDVVCLEAAQLLEAPADLLYACSPLFAAVDAKRARDLRLNII